MCNLPPGRNNQRREGKVDAATAVSFLPPPRLPNPNSIAGQLTIGVATFFRPLGHSDFGRNAHVLLVLPDAASFSSRRGSLKLYLLVRGGDGDDFLPSLDVIVTSPEGEGRGELE